MPDKAGGSHDDANPAPNVASDMAASAAKGVVKKGATVAVEALLAPYVTPTVAAVVAPYIADKVVGKVENVVHTAGRYADWARDLARGSMATAEGPSASPRGQSAAPQVDQDHAHPAAGGQPRNAFERLLDTAASEGLIPRGLAVALIELADDVLTMAHRSEAAWRAAFHLAPIEDRAQGAVPHLAQVRAMEAHHAASTTAVRDGARQIATHLQAIYRRPDAAATELKALRGAARGPGHAAREVAATPELLGALRGGFLRRAERNAALAAVPGLAAAVESHGRAQTRLAEDAAGLRDLRQRPQADPALADALRAHSSLEAVRAAIPGPDPLSADLLVRTAQDAALQVTPADLASATGAVSGPYHAYLADQMQRRQQIESLSATRHPAAAVDHFQAASQALTANQSAAQRLLGEGKVYPAAQATAWAQTAQHEMGYAANAIMANFGQNEEAARRGILPAVMSFRDAMGADQQGAQTQAPPLPSPGAQAAPSM